MKRFLAVAFLLFLVAQAAAYPAVHGGGGRGFGGGRSGFSGGGRGHSGGFGFGRGAGGGWGRGSRGFVQRGFGHRRWGFGYGLGFGYGFGGWGYPYGGLGFYSGYPDVYPAEYPSAYSFNPYVNSYAAGEGTGTAERAPLIINQYSPGGRVQQDAPPGRDLARDNAAPGPTEPLYLVAFPNGSVAVAIAYWIDGGTLHYVTRDKIQKQVALTAIDRPLTEQLNRELRNGFRLP